MARQITISDLKSKVDEGWKKQALADYYGLPMTQMTKLLQTAGLKIRKFHAPLYELIDDTVVAEVPVTEVVEDMNPIAVDMEVQNEVEEQEEPVLEMVDAAASNQTW